MLKNKEIKTPVFDVINSFSSIVEKWTTLRIFFVENKD